MLSRRKGEVDSANRRGLARVGEFNVFQFDNRMLQAKVDVLRMLGFGVGFCFLFSGQGEIVEPRYGVEVSLSLCCGNGHHCKGINEGKGSQHKSQNPVFLSSLHSAKGECRPAYKGNDGTCEYRLLSQVASAIEGVRLGF